MEFRYTTITTDYPASKQFKIVNGEVVKQGAKNVYSGTAEVITTDLQSFAEQLKQFTPKQVLSTGVLLNGNTTAKLTTRNKPKPDHITRTREHFKFDPICLLPIDYDHGQFKSTKEFDAAMNRVILGFDMLQRVYRKSNSGAVYRDDKQVFSKLKFHCYVLLKVSKDPTEAINQVNQLKKIILIRAWNAGFGYCFITKSGVLLDRCLVDVAILGRPESIMYEGMPVLGRGLTYKDAGTYFKDGQREFLDVSTVEPLSDNEIKQYEKLSAKERKRIQPEVDAVRLKYENERVKEFTSAGELTEKEARKIIRNGLKDEKLSMSWPVTLDSGETLLIKDLLADPKKYDRAMMRDPFEPDYGTCKARLYYNDGKKPLIHSLAHGLSRNFYIIAWNETDEKQKQKDSNKGLTDTIREYICDYPGAVVTSRILMDEIGIIGKERGNLRSILRNLVNQGELERVKPGEFVIADKEEICGEWGNVEQRPELDIWQPFGLDEITSIPAGKIVQYAGVFNTGKTAVMVNIAYKNAKKTHFKVNYISTELEKDEFYMKMKALVGNGNMHFFHDKIKFKRVKRYARALGQIINDPGWINIIDYIKIFDKFFDVGKELEIVSEKACDSVSFVAIQKNPNQELGVGGHFTAWEPTQLITLDRSKDQSYCIATARKVKTYKKTYIENGGQPIQGKVQNFRIPITKCGTELNYNSEWSFPVDDFSTV